MLRTDPTAYDEHGYFDGRPVDDSFDAFGQDADGHDVALPRLGEGAAPAALLASRLSGSARDTLRFAVALGGEVPHQAHLPALVGDTHADAALGELAGCGLVSPAGSRYRLAAGVLAQLEAAGYGEDAADAGPHRRPALRLVGRAPLGHPGRAVAPRPTRCSPPYRLVLPATGPDRPAQPCCWPARAAPAFAAGLHWGAWERALRLGQEAARLAGEVAEEAYFHHELGVLALCTRQLDRARAELEASIGLRGALADKRGHGGRPPRPRPGRRPLRRPAARQPPVGGEEVPDARYEESASPPGGCRRRPPRRAPAARRAADAVTHRVVPASGTDARRRPPAACWRRPAQPRRGGRGRAAGRRARHGRDARRDLRTTTRHPSERRVNPSSSRADEGDLDGGLPADEPADASDTGQGARRAADPRSPTARPAVGSTPSGSGRRPTGSEWAERQSVVDGHASRPGSRSDSRAKPTEAADHIPRRRLRPHPRRPRPRPDPTEHSDARPRRRPTSDHAATRPAPASSPSSTTQRVRGPRSEPARCSETGHGRTDRHPYAQRARTAAVRSGACRVCEGRRQNRRSLSSSMPRSAS